MITACLCSCYLHTGVFACRQHHVGKRKTNMIINTQTKKASAQQHNRTAFYSSAAFDPSDRIQALPCMARLQKKGQNTYDHCTHNIKEAHMRSGSAGRPNIYRGLLVSPDALRISTYSSPPCTHEPNYKHPHPDTVMFHVKHKHKHQHQHQDKHKHKHKPKYCMGTVHLDICQC